MRVDRNVIAPLPPRLIEISSLQEHGKKTLGKVLRFFGRITLSPDKAVERPPVDSAEFLERFVCSWRFTLRGQHRAPASSHKCYRRTLRGSANPDRPISPRHVAIKVKSSGLNQVYSTRPNIGLCPTLVLFD